MCKLVKERLESRMMIMGVNKDDMKDLFPDLSLNSNSGTIKYADVKDIAELLECDVEYLLGTNISSGDEARLVIIKDHLIRRAKDMGYRHKLLAMLVFNNQYAISYLTKSSNKMPSIKHSNLSRLCWYLNCSEKYMLDKSCSSTGACSEIGQPIYETGWLSINGYSIKRKLHALDITAEELGEKIGIGGYLGNKVVHSQSFLPKEIAILMAEVLECPLSHIAAHSSAPARNNIPTAKEKTASSSSDGEQMELFKAEGTKPPVPVVNSRSMYDRPANWNEVITKLNANEINKALAYKLLGLSETAFNNMVKRYNTDLSGYVSIKGKKPVEKPDNWDDVMAKLNAGDINKTEAAKLSGLSVGTFYKFYNKYKIAEKQCAGIEAAKASGVHFERPAISKPDNWDEIIGKLSAGNITTVEAIKLTELPKSTFYKFYNEYKAMHKEATSNHDILNAVDELVVEDIETNDTTVKTVAKKPSEAINEYSNPISFVDVSELVLGSPDEFELAIKISKLSDANKKIVFATVNGLLNSLN